jgi:alpha-ribazole phosphatase
LVAAYQYINCMKITLVRHTSLQIAPGICYGQTDIDVGVSFWEEANQLKTKLAGFQFDAVYASPLQRCTKLAVALDYGKVIEDARLMELNFGDWETRAWDDIPRDIFDVWAYDYANLAPPQGETFGQLQRRAINVL